MVARERKNPTFKVGLEGRPFYHHISKKKCEKITKIADFILKTKHRGEMSIAPTERAPSCYQDLLLNEKVKISSYTVLP